MQEPLIQLLTTTKTEEIKTTDLMAQVCVWHIWRNGSWSGWPPHRELGGQLTVTSTYHRVAFSFSSAFQAAREVSTLQHTSFLIRWCHMYSWRHHFSVKHFPSLTFTLTKFSVSLLIMWKPEAESHHVQIIALLYSDRFPLVEVLRWSSNEINENNWRARSASYWEKTKPLAKGTSISKRMSNHTRIKMNYT